MKRSHFNKNILFVALIVCSALIYALSLCVGAENGGRVVDNGQVLSDEQEKTLEAKLADLAEQYGHDIAVVTVETLNGTNVQRYAEDLYQKNGYGVGNDGSGILFLVSIEDREYTLFTNGRAIDIFTENDFTSLENAFWSDLRDGDYYQAFVAFADQSAYIMKYDNRLSPIWIAISLIVGAIVGIIVICVMRSKHKSVKMQRGAGAYMLRNTFHLDRSRDVYLYSIVTRRVKPQNNNSTRGGGSSSSGRSNGGRSGRF